MMTFHSLDRPLESYFLALEKAGLLVEALREPSVPAHAVVSDASRRSPSGAESSVLLRNRCPQFVAEVAQQLKKLIAMEPSIAVVGERARI